VRAKRAGNVRWMADLHDTTEHYLSAVFAIEEEGVPVLRARLVERLQISAPSVTQGVVSLVERGLLAERKDRTLALTARGREIAVSVARRHRLAERLLLDVIGIPWSDIHEEADRWEHAISERVERRLVELLGDPATCPHGNPIPGSRRATGAGRATVALADVETGERQVVRVSEMLERDPDGMRTLERAGVMPGRSIEVVRSSDEVMSIRHDGRTSRVPRALAARVYVAA
jgi:DtxR family transcriptional regulator, Mn-dependent transcriptional regulator